MDKDKDTVLFALIYHENGWEGDSDSDILMGVYSTPKLAEEAKKQLLQERGLLRWGSKEPKLRGYSDVKEVVLNKFSKWGW